MAHTQEGQIYTNEDILHEADRFHQSAESDVKAKEDTLRIQYGGWGNVPNKLKTECANDRRSGGATYTQALGWEWPNSVALSGGQDFYRP